jgi:hypothetical protein
VLGNQESTLLPFVNGLLLELIYDACSVILQDHSNNFFEIAATMFMSILFQIVDEILVKAFQFKPKKAHSVLMF